MDLSKIYVGTLRKNEEVTLEEAIKHRKLVYFKCKNGHVFDTLPEYAFEIYEQSMCPCCRMMNNENYIIGRFNDLKSLFRLDYEIFGGLIADRLVQEDGVYINKIHYNTKKKLKWQVNGKEILCSVRDMINELTEENQDKLREVYNKQPINENAFEVLKCEACGKYKAYHYDSTNVDEVKCNFCKQYMHNPFTFDRWLKEHLVVERKLIEYLGTESLNYLRGLSKDDIDTNILIVIGTESKNTNVYSITHGLIRI